MSNSLKVSTAGLAIVDKSRQRLGWIKASTARWWQDAHTSKATLRRFWQGDYLHYAIAFREKFLSLSVKQLVADLSNADLESIADIPTPYLDCNEFSATPGRKIWRL